MAKVTSDYPLIRIWGYEIMGSMGYYVSAQIEEARKDKAPQNAIYKDKDTGVWHTFTPDEETERRMGFHTFQALKTGLGTEEDKYER